jgi:hypothetical protein
MCSEFLMGAVLIGAHNAPQERHIGYVEILELDSIIRQHRNETRLRLTPMSNREVDGIRGHTSMQTHCGINECARRRNQQIAVLDPQLDRSRQNQLGLHRE